MYEIGEKVTWQVGEIICIGIYRELIDTTYSDVVVIQRGGAAAGYVQRIMTKLLKRV